MNILVLANRDLASCIAVNLLVRELYGAHKFSLWLSASVGRNQTIPVALQRLRYFEQELLQTIIDPLLAPPATYAMSGFSGLTPLLTAAPKLETHINSDSALNSMRQLAPDLIVSIRYGGILKEQAIAVPRYGVINLHSGLLPEYRGVMATFWALVNQADEIGTTLHTIEDPSIDTGQIIKISRQKASTRQSYLAQVLSLYRQGVTDIIAAIAEISSSGTVITTPQTGNPAYYTFPNEKDIQRFIELGLTLIDHNEYLVLIRDFFACPQLTDQLSEILTNPH